MIRVQLPDGSERELQDGASARDLAQAIGPGLAKAAVAAKVNEKGAEGDPQVRDLSRPLADGDVVAIVTMNGVASATMVGARGDRQEALLGRLAGIIFAVVAQQDVVSVTARNRV